MAATSRTRSGSGPVPLISAAFRRSITPSGGFGSSSVATSPFFHHHRSSSPTRVNLAGAQSPSRSVRFSIERPTSPGRSLSVADRRASKKPIDGGGRRSCSCSPTTHPGSFRCGLHKGCQGPGRHRGTFSAPASRLNARRSAMTNSLVRIGTVEGDLVKRALAALIRPSSHQQRRRSDFQRRPSRLSIMSKSDGL